MPLKIDDLSSSDIGRAFGVARQTVASWSCPKRKVKISGTEYTRYNLPDVIAWKIAEAQAAVSAKPSTKAEADAIKRKREAEAGLKEAELGERLGLLVRADDVIHHWERVLATFRQQLEGIGATLSKRLEHKTAKEINAILEQKVQDIIQETANAYAQGIDDADDA